MYNPADDKKKAELSFYQYLTIKQKSRAMGITPYAQVTQFDNAKVTYKEADEALSTLFQATTKYIDSYGTLAIDSVSLLISLLNQKNLLSNQDVKALANAIKNQKEDPTKDDEHKTD